MITAEVLYVYGDNMVPSFSRVCVAQEVRRDEGIAASFHVRMSVWDLKRFQWEGGR